MAHIIFDSTFAKFNKDIENRHNKLKLLIRILSADNANSQLFHELITKAMKCNDSIEKITYSTDNNLNHTTTIDSSALSFINNFFKVELFKKNHKLYSLLIKKRDIYLKLMQDKRDFEINKNMRNIGQAAKLLNLQKQLISIKENVGTLRNQIEIMNSQAVKFKINKKNFQIDIMSVKNTRQIITDNAEKISLKTEMCLRKMIDINHQIIAGKNLFKDMQKLFLSAITLNEKIYVFINGKVIKKSISLDSLNINNSNNKQLYLMILTFFQLLQDKKKSSQLIKTCQSKSEDTLDEFKSIKMYIGKIKTYFESLNNINSQDLSNTKMIKKLFWVEVDRFESTIKEWEVLKDVVFND